MLALGTKFEDTHTYKDGINVANSVDVECRVDYEGSFENVVPYGATLRRRRVVSRERKETLRRVLDVFFDVSEVSA